MHSSTTAKYRPALDFSASRYHGFRLNYVPERHKYYIAVSRNICFVCRRRYAFLRPAATAQ